MSFEKIFTHGVLVDVNISIWSARTQLQAEDLGIQSEHVPESFSLGHMKLIPSEVMSELNHFDYMIRALLKKHSFPFEFGEARFVPKKVFPTFSDEFDTINQEFQKKIDEFVASYPRYKLQMRQEFTKAANQAYERLLTLCGFDKPRDEFVNEFLERVEALYPSEEKIRSKFSAEYVVFQVSLPDLSQATYETVAADNEKMALMQKAYEKALYKRVQSFVDNVVNEQRSNAVKVMSHVAENMKKGKRFTTATLNSLRKMVTEYERMDVLDDADMLKRLRDLKERVLDHITAKQVAESAKLSANLRKELEALVVLANDREAIAALAENYRQRIQL
ncbi:MAG: DUF3150 domain-containing protein [Candidatus Altiarchaeales archaeon]|nr:DUF3150 domain-containing protein [Candidatus Altiarchaeales archaeon]